jgi:multiple sugar transport system substrate-binding protein
MLKLLFLGLAASLLLVVGVACGSGAQSAAKPAVPAEPAKPAAPPQPAAPPLQFPEKFPLGTELRITQWSHFVPRWDQWFDKWAPEWGEKNGVKVTVQHISYADVSSTLTAAIAAGRGPTLMQDLASPAQFIEGLQDLTDVNLEAQRRHGKQVDNCTRQSFLPKQKIWYGFCHGWVPDPGDYRVSLWEKVGLPKGPSTYQELLEGGKKVKEQFKVPVGVGMSPEIDSEFFARSIIWSYGGSVQDENDNVTLNSPKVVEAVEFAATLFKEAMTPEIFAWNAASNNQGMIAGSLSYIQNSISYYRSAQKTKPDIAKDVGMVKPLKGPTGLARNTAHVWHIYVIPKYVTDKDQILAAKKFMLDLVANYGEATLNSELYDFPAFPSTSPDLFRAGGWLDNDPYGSVPPDKLKVLSDAEQWTGWMGYPGYANPAISEVYNTFLLSTMMAQVARGEKTAEKAVADTAAQIETIFNKWRAKGYVGGTRK